MRNCERASPRSARDAKDLPAARRLFAQALETPGGLKIQTIHSFCQYLLARFPLEADVPAAFDVLDDATARELIAAARTRVLERAGSGDATLSAAAAHLVTETSESRLQQILDAALGQRPAQAGALLRQFAGRAGCDVTRHPQQPWRRRARHARTHRGGILR